MFLNWIKLNKTHLLEMKNTNFYQNLGKDQIYKLKHNYKWQWFCGLLHLKTTGLVVWVLPEVGGYE
jgi:hypothetical protein